MEKSKMENQDLLAPNKSTLQSRIEKVKKHKEQFKTPCVVQGLGTTWENWVSQSWSNIAM
jgi:hypothetical protein